jgi:hypothetical protein
MARPRTAMREIREVLRLCHEAGLSERQIARSLRIAVNVTNDRPGLPPLGGSRVSA